MQPVDLIMPILAFRHSMGYTLQKSVNLVQPDVYCVIWNWTSKCQQGTLVQGILGLLLVQTTAFVPMH